MFKHRYIIVMSVLLLFLTASGVCAAEDNMTDELGENLAIDEMVAEDSNEETLDLENTEANLTGSADYGVYVDASEAYVYLNEFRAEEGVWHWTSDDTTVIYFNTNDNNQLKSLERDTALEEAAKVRAKEIYDVFGHTRPDGSQYYTTFPDGYAKVSENLACAYTIEEATEALKETYLPFDGQGHRRSMLGSYNRVGIAAYKRDGLIYLAQAFGMVPTGDDSNPQNNTPVENLATFSNLNNLIKNSAYIKLKEDYAFGNESGFADGIVISRAVTIDGCGHTIDARKSARIFSITADNVVLKNIRFTNGLVDYDFGGAIRSSGKSLTVVNCTFIDNFAYYGAALSSSKGKISITDCTFINNWGIEGVVYSNNGFVSVSNSRFLNNTAMVYGGVLSLNNGNGTVSDCTFIDNTAFNGGAISLNNDYLSIADCSFTTNFAFLQGGAVYSNGGTVSVSSTRFVNNAADIEYYASGGALYSRNGRVYITDCDFIGSANLYKGGAVYCADCDVSISGCGFINGTSLDGGALYLLNSDTTVDMCSFINNSANSNNYITYGGAISSSEGTVHVSDSIFTDNSASDGGAIYGSCDLYVDRCGFTRNTADYGGAIDLVEANATLNDCSFADNTVSVYGGAVSSVEGDVFLYGCVFTDSFAHYGAAFYSSLSNVHSQNCSFIDNSVFSADNAGGSAMFLDYGNAQISACRFVNNSADAAYHTYGGAIFLGDGQLLLEDSNFTESSACYGGVLFSMQSDLTIQGCDFANDSSYEGGAMFLSASTGKVSDCSFTSNSADYMGGAILSVEGTVDIADSSFTDNSAQSAGAVYGCNAVNSIFTGNRARDYAGAIYGVDNTAVNCRFINNTALRNNPLFGVSDIGCTFKDNGIVRYARIYADDFESTANSNDIMNVNLITADNERVFNEEVKIRIYKGDVLLNTFSCMSGKGWAVSLDEGSYVAQLSMEGQSYIANPVNVTLTITKKEYAKITAEVNNTDYLNPTVVDIKSNVEGNVMIYIDNAYAKGVAVAADKISQITFNDISSGKHTLTVVLTPKNSKIEKSTCNREFTVFKKQTEITLEVEDTTSVKHAKVYVTASDNGRVSIKTGGIVKYANVAANARTQIDLGVLIGGSYGITATFCADENYIASSDSKTIKVLNVIDPVDITISMPQNNPNQVAFNLPSNASGKLTLTIAGKTYDATIRNGVAQFKLPDLAYGEYPYVIKYSGDGKYSSFTANGKYVVKKDETNSTNVSENVTVKPEIIIPPLDNPSSDGSIPVSLPADAKGTVTLTVNGKSYVFDVVNGKANVKLPDLTTGNYKYSITYSGDGKYSSFTESGSLKVSGDSSNPAENQTGTGGNSSQQNPTVTDNSKVVASNIKVTYKKGSYYLIKVYGKDGELANGVAVHIAGKIVKSLTATNGIAKFKVTQKPGTYKMTISALGKSVNATLTVKHLVTLKKVTVKKSAKKLTLQATLGKVNGKYLKYKKITFKFNGKKYTAKTNKKGVAKVTIKSAVLKKLKVNKKVTYQATYLKDTVKKSAKVKR